MEKNILIIDDNQKLCESLSANFVDIGYNVFIASTTKESVQIINTREIHAIILDLKLGSENGVDTLVEIQDHKYFIPVIILTGFATVDTAVKTLKIGAFDYLKKPISFAKLRASVDAALAYSTRDSINISGEKNADKIITRNRKTEIVCDRAIKLSNTDFPILISGESGTGKEMIAALIHRNSQRKSEKMLRINCAAFAESLLDNELFGHEKGAYTGADSVFMGVFERADGGTLFLDEIGDMALSIQAKILRTLQNNEIRRLGGSETKSINVRFIAATNKNIPKMVETGKFRQDLFFRLNTGYLRLPPLRERKEDIPLLIEDFLSRIDGRNPAKKKIMSQEVIEFFYSYTWPGNIRELINVINYSATIAVSNSIKLSDLPPYLTDEYEEDINNNKSIEEQEKSLILKALNETNNNKSEAARILKMNRKTLYNKLAKYNLSI